MTTKTINPTLIVKNLAGRYNFVIFVVIVSAVLIGCVIFLTSLLNQSTSDDIITSSNFDRATINQLSKLQTSSTNTSYESLPSGRINPFFE